MFGTNPIRKQVQDDGATLRVQSIWFTIQGEGPFAGTPAVFIRLAGCSLSCFFCDTDFESGYHNVLSVTSIGDKVLDALGASIGGYEKILVVLTGGEPLRQNILPLCRYLTTGGFQVQIETAGPVWVTGLEELIEQGSVSLVCSPKTGKVNPKIQQHCRHWKYIINDGEVAEDDGLPNRSTQTPGVLLRLARPPRVTDTVWLQPCEVYDVEKVPLMHVGVHDNSSEELADQLVTSSVRDVEKSTRNILLAARLAMKFNYRVSLQLHKILGLP
jgi:7-carboxy-7-deazaguanine synthase